MEKLLEKLGLMQIQGYKFVSSLSGGQMSSATCLYENDKKDKVVLKFLIAPRNQRERNNFLSEWNAYKMLDKLPYADHLIKPKVDLYDDVEGAVSYFGVEFVDGETLAKFIEDKRFTEEEAIMIVGRIAIAMENLSTMYSFCHRDLHPGNIMVLDAPPDYKLDGESFSYIKILDMGLCRNRVHDTFEGKEIDKFRHEGAICSWSPEFLDNANEMRPNHDVWALGNILYRILDPDKKYAIWGDNFSEIVISSKKKNFERKFSNYINSLLGVMLEPNPEKRIYFQGVRQICSDILSGRLENFLNKYPTMYQHYFEQGSAVFVRDCGHFEHFPKNGCYLCDTPDTSQDLFRPKELMF